MTKMRLEELRQEVDENCYCGNIEVKLLDDLPQNQIWNGEYIRENDGKKLTNISTFFGKLFLSKDSGCCFILGK